QARMRAVLGALASERDIASARPVERERVLALLEPWIGAAARSIDLPLPELVEVSLRGDAGLDPRALETRLAATAPGVHVDDHSQLRDGFARLARVALLCAAGVLALIAAASAGAVVFATRAGIAIHHEAIEILHQMGAADTYVARQFAVHAARVSLLG